MRRRRTPSTGTTPEPQRNQEHRRNPIVETGVPQELQRNFRSASSLLDFVPRITTNIAGFTRREWEQVRLAAAALQARGAEAGTLILPDRPELYRLDRTGPRAFTLRLTDGNELAETVRQDAWRRQAV